MASRQVNFRCPTEKFERFEHAARAANKTLTAWLIGLGMVAVGETADLEQLERVRKSAQKSGSTKSRRKRAD